MTGMQLIITDALQRKQQFDRRVPAGTPNDERISSNAWRANRFGSKTENRQKAPILTEAATLFDSFPRSRRAGPRP